MLTADLLDHPATLPAQALSPAQAIHLASAREWDLTAFVACDEALLAAANDAGLLSAPLAVPQGPGRAIRVRLAIRKRAVLRFRTQRWRWIRVLRSIRCAS